MKSTKGYFLLFICLILGILLRIWQLGRIPEGFYSDEALYGYEAFSILKTGRDQFGTPLPLAFAGFGDYRPGLYIYSSIPFIFLLGLTEFATRLPSAVYSILTLCVTYLVIKKLLPDTKTALLGLLILSLSPWSLYFARMAHETNLVTLLIITGIYFWLRVKDCFGCLIFSLICFAASLYAYHSSRVFVPIFLLVTSILQWRELKRQGILLIWALVLFLILTMPLLYEIQSGGWSRVKGISFWDDAGLISYINAKRGQALENGISPQASRILYNKVTIYPKVFFTNYFSHFSLEFLLTKGDPNGVYNTPRTGILLWVEPLLILTGLLYFWINKRSLFWWIGGAVLISLIPDSLTKVAPSSARIHLGLPFVAVLNAVGLRWILRRSKQLYIVVSGILIFGSLWFWHNYLVVRPVENIRAWQVGVKEMVLKAQKYTPNYERIWISRSGWGWIHILFHTKYDPQIFQKETRPSVRNELGFWWVSDFGRYHLEWFPQSFELTSKTLYIGLPEEFPQGTQPFDKVIKKNQDIYWLVSGNMLINPY